MGFEWARGSTDLRVAQHYRTPGFDGFMITETGKRENILDVKMCKTSYDWGKKITSFNNQSRNCVRMSRKTEQATQPSIKAHYISYRCI